MDGRHRKKDYKRTGAASDERKCEAQHRMTAGLKTDRERHKAMRRQLLCRDLNIAEVVAAPHQVSELTRKCASLLPSHFSFAARLIEDQRGVPLLISDGTGVSGAVADYQSDPLLSEVELLRRFLSVTVNEAPCDEAVEAGCLEMVEELLGFWFSNAIQNSLVKLPIHSQLLLTEALYVLSCITSARRHDLLLTPILLEILWALLEIDDYPLLRQLAAFVLTFSAEVSPRRTLGFPPSQSTASSPKNEAEMSNLTNRADANSESGAGFFTQSELGVAAIRLKSACRFAADCHLGPVCSAPIGVASRLAPLNGRWGLLRLAVCLLNRLTRLRDSQISRALFVDISVHEILVPLIVDLARLVYAARNSDSITPPTVKPEDGQCDGSRDMQQLFYSVESENVPIGEFVLLKVQAAHDCRSSMTEALEIIQYLLEPLSLREAPTEYFKSESCRKLIDLCMTLLGQLTMPHEVKDRVSSLAATSQHYSNGSSEWENLEPLFPSPKDFEERLDKVPWDIIAPAFAILQELVKGDIQRWSCEMANSSETIVDRIVNGKYWNDNIEGNRGPTVGQTMDSKAGVFQRYLRSVHLGTLRGVLGLMELISRGLPRHAECIMRQAPYLLGFLAGPFPTMIKEVSTVAFVQSVLKDCGRFLGPSLTLDVRIPTLETSIPLPGCDICGGRFSAIDAILSLLNREQQSRPLIRCALDYLSSVLDTEPSALRLLYHHGIIDIVESVQVLDDDLVFRWTVNFVEKYFDDYEEEEDNI